MAYWMRVFCTKGEPPPLEDVLAWVAERGPALALDTNPIDVEPSSPGWTQAAISYRLEKQPFLAETTMATEPEAKEELEEFVELLEDSPDSSAKEKFWRTFDRRHSLSRTKFPRPILTAMDTTRSASSCASSRSRTAG